MLATLVVLVFWAIAGVLRLLEKTLTFASSLLERTIARYHSIVFALADAVWGNISAAWHSSSPPTAAPARGSPRQSSAAASSTTWQHHAAQHSAWPSASPKTHDSWRQRKTSSRAYWDPSKGSAIVIWSAGDQTFSQSLALALAAQHARKRPTRAGQPPYTVIVIVPSSTDGLTELIGAWARTKAEATKHEEEEKRKKRRGAQRDGSETSSSSSSSAGGEAEKILPDTSKGISKHRRDTTASASSSTLPSKKPSKRRKLSIGGWSTSDVVGYGVGMLKGLHVGQEDVARGIGAVIPVVADTSTTSGIAYAQSTIQDYCISHDLLLRGLIIVPSIMTMSGHVGSPSPKQGDDKRREEASQSPSATTRSRNPTPPKTPTAASQALARMAADTALALESDVKEALQVIAVLHPSLQTDGGRIIGLVPSMWRSEGAYESLLRATKGFESLLSVPLVRVKTSRKQASTTESDYDVVRTALLEMWDQVERALRVTAGGVSVARVGMAPMPAAQKASRAGATSRRAVRGKDSFLHMMLAPLASILHPLFYPVHPSPFVRAMSDLRAAAAGAGSDSAEGVFGDDWDSSSEEEEEDDDKGDPLGGLGTHTGMPSEASIPPLLTQAIRSLLARSVPRKRASIGLGPRIELLWTYIPGHAVVQRWLAATLS